MKLAFIGTGKIIADALFAVEPIEELEKTAIFARPHSKEKGEALAEKYGIQKVYTDYDELLAESDADTVYIGLINSAHYSYGKKALMAGKHVIMEKPFTATFEQALDLKRTAEEHGVYIMEAVTVLHNEIVDIMKENLPRLGRIKAALCNYSQYSSRYDSYLAGEVEHAFDPAFYGGALYDINIYNIHYLVELFGAPKKAEYFPNIGFNGIDTSGIAILTFPDFVASCTGAKDADSPGFISIQGEKGYMKIDGKPNIAYSLDVEYADPDITEKVRDEAGAMVRATIKKHFESKSDHHRMTREFRDFVRIMDGHDTEAASKSLQESLDTIKVLEEARTSAGIVFGK
ncbi:MAG: Gfo/Idh/MocA family oxidoreductase [Lachnospiraceae bacterium]|nr:Gfo/Idh/MocA family oxidoreductase [Lachnospiraceae bacterium]